MITEYRELVVDTNIFLHSNNAQNKYFESSFKLLNELVDNNIKLCVDDEFNTDEAKNTSWIGSEYVDKIHPGTFGYAILLKTIINGNILQIEKKKFNKQKSKLTKLIQNKADLVFLIITLGTESQTFASNDYEDFQQDKRNKIYKDYKISILNSNEMTNNK
jgi:predicted nucleic acid-binding protein